MSTNLTYAAKHRKIDDEIAIGKDVIELITGAMYVNPMCFFREYVQNAADSIDQARAAGLYDSGSVAPVVAIKTNLGERSLIIRDTGAGLPRSTFSKRLSAIGASQKRGTKARGFRGVGRLCGLGYCQELIFRSRAPGENVVSEMIWDGRRLRELLRSREFAGGLADLVRECASVSTAPAIDQPAHFFEVELRRVARHRNDMLLHAGEIRAYLEQVAPVPFHRDFSLGPEITKKLEEHGIRSDLAILIDGHCDPVTRPFRDEFALNDRLSDSFRSVDFFEIPGISEGIDAIGWTLTHSCLGGIPQRLGIGGIRARVGNIQVGGAALLEHCFPEQRFNSWYVGEVHVLGKALVPNARRDDFEANAAYGNLQVQISQIGRGFAKRCRELSSQRNQIKLARDTLFRAQLLEETFLHDRAHPAIVRSAARRLRQYSKKLLHLCQPAFIERHSADDLLSEVVALQARLGTIDETCAQPHSSGLAVEPGCDPEKVVEDVFGALFDLTADSRTVAKVYKQVSDRLATYRA
jgi:molecular chaperone HtpG